MKTLIDECKKMLITDPEDCLGGWGLIDADPVYVLDLTQFPFQPKYSNYLCANNKARYVYGTNEEVFCISRPAVKTFSFTKQQTYRNGIVLLIKVILNLRFALYWAEINNYKTECFNCQRKT